MFQILWEKKIKFRLQLQGILSRTPAPWSRRSHVPPIFWQRGTRGTIQICRSSVFRASGSATEFSDDIAALFARFWKKIYFTTKFINFCTSDRIDHRWDEFQEPKKIRIWSSHVWVVDIWWVETAKGIHSDSTFHRYHWFAGKHFPVSCAGGIPPFFALASPCLEPLEFSGSQIR